MDTEVIMNDLIELTIRETIQEEEKKYSKTYWKDPIIGYAHAKDPLFRHIKGWVSEKHLLPHDILPDAIAVIVFFIPFIDDIVASNLPGRNASYEWGETYIKTNQVIATINRLKLNKESDTESRLRWIRDFCDEHIDFNFLKRNAPFIAYELQRQDLVDKIKSIMRT